MDIWKIYFAFVLSVAVYILLIKGSEGRWRTDEFFSWDDDSEIPNSPEIDEYTVEQLWINCGVDLIQIKESAQNSDMLQSNERNAGYTEINFESKTMTIESLQRLVEILPPQMKYTLFDCLSRQNFRFPISAVENGSKNWYTKHFQSLLGWQRGWSRRLADRQDEAVTAAAPAPSPSPAHSPSAVPPRSSSRPVPSPAPASSPSPRDKTLVDVPDPLLTDDYPLEVEPSSTGSDSSKKRHVPQVKRSKEANTDSKKVIFLCIALTAVGTLLLVTLIFCCYLKCCKKKDTLLDGRKDDKPLLTLSSLGSSQKSSGLGSSFDRDKFENLFCKTDHPNKNAELSFLDANCMSIESDIAKSSVLETPSSEVAGVDTDTQVPPSQKTTPSLPGPPPAPRPQPPPPPKVVPPRPPPRRAIKPSPLGPNRPGALGQENADSESDAPKAKLKPFFWEKVLASPDQSMVWHEISAGSFQFNEEMIESLFGYASNDKDKNGRNKQSTLIDNSNQYVRILEPKKAQNLSILVRALNVTTEEVHDALVEGNELPTEFLQTLFKMAPSPDEELKIRLYSGEFSQLGLAERFLKGIVDIPFAFKRVDTLLFMGNFQEEVSGVKDSLATMEVASTDLRCCRLFRKLLEAVLKTGNRMNDGTYRGGAQAFKLDTLLKLADVKGKDGKTTLLEFVVQEIIRTEGIRKARTLSRGFSSVSSISSISTEDLTEDCQSPTSTDNFHTLGLQVVSGLAGELVNVKKAAIVDSDSLIKTVERLEVGLTKVKGFLNSEVKAMEEEGRVFRERLMSFVENAERDVAWLLEEEKRVKSIVKSTTDYFHGGGEVKDEGLHLFVVVRDFILMVDKTCREVKGSIEKKKEVARRVTVSPVPDPRQQLLFPAAIMERRVNRDSSSGSSSSDDDES